MIWFLSLICFALPAYLIRFKIFGIPTTALEILIYLTVLIQIGFFIKSKNFSDLKSQTSKLILSNILIPIALFLLAAVISTTISPDKRVSLGIFKGWIIDPILLFGLIVLNVKSEADFKKMIYGLVGGATIVSFWGILQAFGFSYLLPHQRTDPSFLSYLASGRAFGPFESPNYLGMYLAPISAIALGQLLISNIKTQNYFLSFAVAASLLALLFTKSFGAWLGFLVAALFLVWLHLSKEKRSIFWALLVLTIVIGMAAILKYQPQRILDSFSARKEVWQVSWFLIKEHPISGIGLGTFKQIYTQVIPQIHFPPINWLQMHPHNIFLAFWLNMGILGLLSFLWLLYLFFKNLISHNSYLIILIAPMVAIIAHGLIDTTYWKNDLSAMFWIIMGLAVILYKLQGEENENRD